MRTTGRGKRCRNGLRSTRVFARGVQHLHSGSQYCRGEIPSRSHVEADLVSIRSTSTIWNMLHADDAAIVSRSPASLVKMMAAVVEVCGVCGLTVAEGKMGTMITRPPHHTQEGLEIVAAGQRYAQIEQFAYLGGTITAEADMTAEIQRRTEAAWSVFRRYASVIYDRSITTVPLTLKA